MRRVLAQHDPDPESGADGPSWLTFMGYDSLWSLDLWRCESILLRSHFGEVGPGRLHATARRFRRRTRPD